MNKKIVNWLTVAAFVTLIGLIIFGGAMTVMKWDFSKLSTAKYQINQHEVNESYHSISVDTRSSDVIFVPSDTEKTTVVCRDRDKLEHTVSVNEGVLTITVEDTRKWYDHIGITFGSPKITVSIPSGEYGSLKIRSRTGDVAIPSEFKFESISITENTGDVSCEASASSGITIKCTTGDIKVKNISADSLELTVSTGRVSVSNVTCLGKVTVSVDTGDAKLTDLKCNELASDGDTGDLSMERVVTANKLNIRRDTGDVRLEDCDAGEIFIKTSTGDVNGTLLTEKVFMPQSDTGRIDVPKTASGGRCEIITSTGDIRIKLK